MAEAHAARRAGARRRLAAAPARRSGDRVGVRLHRRCVLLVGSLYSSSFLSPEYLLQQLKVASFLGVIATGAMIVILLGQIDLSVPWVVAVGGMMATAATGWGPLGEALAIPVGIGCGVALGPGQRRRRRLPAHPVDGRHARGQRRRAGADGGAHRRLLAAGFVVAGDALHRHRPQPARHSERAAGVGRGRRRRRVPAARARRSAARSTRSATASARRTCRARARASS